MLPDTEVVEVDGREPQKLFWLLAARLMLSGEAVDGVEQPSDMLQAFGAL
jgi:hypothetical protein